jgi:MarR family transcriptional regulator, negative regulator of the multidrug operon emrRAB
MKNSARPFDTQKREQWLTFVQELSPEADPRAIRLVGQMRTAAQALYRINEGSLTAAGLSYAKYRLLMSLLFAERFQGDGPLNPSEISERLGASRNTISALIRDLETDGYIERTLDKDDRRRFLIGLTAAGREIVREYAGRHFAAVGACFSQMSVEEQQQLSQLLDKLTNNIMEIASE